MSVQIRTSTLSDEQTALEDRYHKAQAILKAAGINAEVIKCVVANVREDPCYITVH